MAAPLTVHNAEIKTAAVEIKTLTISGKQVTLAVFRQLREEPLISEDGTLNGVPWGVVNYHPDKCGGDNGAQHWHVVWQRGTELLRSAVTREPTWGAFQSKLATHFLSAHIRDVLLGNDTRHFGGSIPTWDNWLTIELGGIRVAIKPSPAASVAARAHRGLSDARDEAQGDPKRYVTYRDDAGHLSCGKWGDVEPRLQRRQANALEVLDQELGPRDGATESLFTRLQGAVEAEVQRRGRHHEVRKAISDLPQLFIAV